MGILLIATALLLTLKKGGTQESGNKKRWLAFAIAASLVNGAAAICQKLYALSFERTEGSGFVAWSYITAFLLSFAVCLVKKITRKNGSFALTSKVATLGISAGAVLAVFQLMNTYAISTIEASIIFPSYYGGSMVLSALSGVIILKDKLTRKQICAICLGVIALVLLNI